MRRNYLLLLFIVSTLLTVSACHKDKPVPADQQISGQWLQASTRLYADSANIRIYDTTYTRPFTASDYIQFNINGTCTISSDHYYYPNHFNYPKTPQAITPTSGAWLFTSLGGSVYLLTPPPGPANPGGFDIRDTARLVDAHTLWLHVTFYSHAPGFVSYTDSYYKK